jgi:hypothetical protein
VNDRVVAAVLDDGELCARASAANSDKLSPKFKSNNLFIIRVPLQPVFTGSTVLLKAGLAQILDVRGGPWRFDDNAVIRIQKLAAHHLRLQEAGSDCCCRPQ